MSRLLLLAGLVLALHAGACQGGAGEPPREDLTVAEAAGAQQPVSAAPLATDGEPEPTSATGRADFGEDLDPARFPAAHAALLKRAGATPVTSLGGGTACAAR